MKCVPVAFIPHPFSNKIKMVKNFHPDLSQSWLLIALLVVAGSLLAAFINIIVLLASPSMSGSVEMLTYPVLFIPPAIAIYYISKSKAGKTESFSEINSPDFGKIGKILTFILLLPLVFSINIISEPLTHWMGVPDFLINFINKIQDNKISGFLAVVIFAPLLEEVFCRGIILRGLLTNGLSPAKAIIWSSLMFAIMHLNPWQAIPAFILGALMGWVYWKTHSLWAAIFIHFVNNGFSYIVTVFFPEIPAHYGYIDLIPESYYFVVYVVSILFSAGVIYLMNKNYVKTISVKIHPDY